MRLFHGTDNAEIQRPTVLTLGVFDGLHLGHQLIMRTVVDRAQATGAVPTVITFDPHPRAVLHPESAPPLLQTLDQKMEGLGGLGIEQTIVVRFDEAFSQLRAGDFLHDVVKDRLNAKEVYLGCGFAFGHDREGISLQTDTTGAQQWCVARQDDDRRVVVEVVARNGGHAHHGSVTGAALDGLLDEADIRPGGGLLLHLLGDPFGTMTDDQHRALDLNVFQRMDDVHDHGPTADHVQRLGPRRAHP